ncbi:hypothetical protein Mgra_00006076 [Meloidogyne graminicola]|uniref:Uncharacterized protein n=1 Tax=Meloidogyne graminicola TaxID=189291 RepID=A0A8S9ZMI4_9BILA|nr:hypothetical protein Mgra_00006076 [Meloidogyne graminicola]
MYFIFQLIFVFSFFFNFIITREYPRFSSDEYDNEELPLLNDWNQPKIYPTNSQYSGKEKSGGYGPFGVGLFGLMKGEGKNYDGGEISPISWLKGLLFGGK